MRYVAHTFMTSSGAWQFVGTTQATTLAVPLRSVANQIYSVSAVCD